MAGGLDPVLGVALQCPGGDAQLTQVRVEPLALRLAPRSDLRATAVVVHFRRGTDRADLIGTVSRAATADERSAERQHHQTPKPHAPSLATDYAATLVN